MTFLKQTILPSLLIVMFAASAPSLSFAEEKSGHSITGSLKDAGISTLPTFLDAATNDIAITFPHALGGKTLKFGGTIDADALQEKKFVFETSEDHEVTWNNAFGLSFLDLHGVGLNLTIGKGEFDISLDGHIGGPFKKGKHDIEVEIDLSIEDGKLNDFMISLPDTKLSLAELSLMKHIPGVHKFDIQGPAISRHAIEGKIDFMGQSADALVFEDPDIKSWVVALSFPKPISLADITGHKIGFMQHITLPEMNFISSRAEFSRAYDELPGPAQKFFQDDEGNLPEGDLEVAEGANVVASFASEQAPKGVQNALKNMGLGNITLDINGTVAHLFSGEPALELTAAIDMPSNHGFGFLKAKDDKAEFFITYSKEETDIGFRNAMLLPQGHGHKDLEFDIDFGMRQSQSEIEVFVAGGMKGDWANAAGIKGYTLENPYLSAGINETGSFDIMIDGTSIIGKEQLRVAADMVLSPEAAGLPTAIALAGELNKLSFNDLIIAAEKMAKHNGGFGHLKVAFEDIGLAFMTPGAHLPADLEEELQIEGEGIALKGSLYVNNKELGSVSGYASTDGVSFDGKLDPFKLGPLHLKEAELDIAGGPEVEPKFAFVGDMELFKGFEENFELHVQPNSFKFMSDTKFGGAFDLKLEAETTNGLSFSPSNDLDFDAELSTKYTEAFHKLTRAAVQGMKKAEKAVNNAKDKVKKAEKDVNSLNGDIKTARANAKASFDKAIKSIKHAQHKVDSLNDLISINRKKAHDYNKRAKHDASHWKFSKAAKDGVKAGEYASAEKAEQVSLKTAKWALKQAKGAVNLVPVDSAPQVVLLETELKVAKGTLEAAREFLSGINDINKGVEHALTEIDKGTFVVESIGVKGSLKGIVSGGKSGEATVLSIDVKIAGKRHKYHLTLDMSKLERGFDKIVENLAESAAKEIINVFKS